MRWLLLFGALTISACIAETSKKDAVSQSNTASQSVAQEQVVDPFALEDGSAQERFECEQNGGSYERGYAFMVCVMPTSDAGQSCTSSSQCEGHCLADGGVCTPRIPYFGCYETLEGGQVAVLCVD